MNELTVQVAQRGVITLPKELREAHDVKTGDTFAIIDLGEGTFVLSRRKSKLEYLSSEIRNALEEKGETLESMLIRLREERERYGSSKA